MRNCEAESIMGGLKGATSMTVVLVEFSPGGGLFHFAYQYAQGLAERGHRVQLLTGPTPELSSDQPGFEILSILPTWQPGSGSEPVWYRKLRRVGRGVRHVVACGKVALHVRRLGPDVVQWAAWRFAIDGLVAALVARRGWAQVSVELTHEPRPLQEQRSTGSFYREGRILSFGLARGFGAMNTVLVLGESSRRELLHRWDCVRRCDVIPHGDESVLAGKESPPAPSSCPPCALMFGSITGYKGVDLLLEAWPSVKSEVPDSTLLIVGSLAPDMNGPLLRAQVAQMEGVELRLGYVPVSDIPALVGGVRMAVAPYHRSSASGAVRVAQTLGRPVIVTDVGDLTSSVEEGVSGLVVPPGDAQALAAAMVLVLRDNALADRLGSNGRSQLKAHSSWSVVAEKVEVLFRRELAGVASA
jgi:glycosyltransferase involved in cell wall biosynthesis